MLQSFHVFEGIVLELRMESLLTAASIISQSSSPIFVPILILAITLRLTATKARTRHAIFTPTNGALRSSLACACIYAISSGVGCSIVAVVG